MTGTISSDDWRSTSLTMLAALLSLAVWTDIRQRRIPNTLVLVMLMTGLLLNLVPTDSVAHGGLFTEQPGALGGWLSLAGAFTALLLLLPFWLLRVMGAGDVKLFAGVGAFAGPADSVNMALCVLLAGGGLALARLALWPDHVQVGHHLRAMLHALRSGTGSSRFDPLTQTAWRMPYAVAIAAGVLGYGVWTLSGHPPILNF